MHLPERQFTGDTSYSHMGLVIQVMLVLTAGLAVRRAGPALFFFSFFLCFCMTYCWSWRLTGQALAGDGVGRWVRLSDTSCTKTRGGVLLAWVTLLEFVP